MKLLLDTHVLIWSINGDSRLPDNVISAIEDTSNVLYLSTASLWEAAIKSAKGKLHVPGQSIDFLLNKAEESRTNILPIVPAHIRFLEALPPHHSDPFDRMLVAQANAEELRLVTSDSKIAMYTVDILW